MKMNSKLSSDEIHQVKTAVLAEQQAQRSVPASDLQNGTNYVLHLNAFFAHAKRDHRLKANHFSLYVALFHCWNTHHFEQPFKIHREQVMRVCKIRSVNTYTQCLKWLHICGYIDYQPSGVLYMPAKVSMLLLAGNACSHQHPGIHFNTMGNKKNNTRAAKKNDTRAGNKISTGNDIKNNTVTVSNLIHNINNKQINYETESKQAPTQEKFHSNQKKAPGMETVVNWFSERGKTDQEARKFFYHYSAVNWTLGGQTITDWHAAAAKWLENEKAAGNFKPAKLHTDDNKDYSKSL